MQICPNCNAEFDEKSKYGIKKFCSRPCANSNRTHSPEVRKRISESVKKQLSEVPVDVLEKRKEATRERNRKMNAQRKEDGFYEALKGTKTLVLAEQQGKCNRCDLDEWQGEKLPLELEHKDGNRRNNERSNLEYLCPNCHSLTPTWRGRNKKGMSTPSIPVEGFKSIRQYLISEGLSPKGGNYKAAKRKLGLE